jgi:hypothetical protein
MLPDFLVIKRQIADDLTNRLRSEQRQDSLFSLFKQFRQHEGDRFTMIREDQTAHTSRYRRVEMEGTLKVDDVLRSGTKAVRDMLDTMGEGLAKDEAQAFMSMMDQATEEAGTVVHGKGQPFSAEHFIEAISKIELSFDDNGNWEMPTMIMHPLQEARFHAVMKQIDDTADVKARVTAIVDKKREEWLAREARRTLVD